MENIINDNLNLSSSDKNLIMNLLINLIMNLIMDLIIMDLMNDLLKIKTVF